MLKLIIGQRVLSLFGLLYTENVNLCSKMPTLREILQQEQTQNTSKTTLRQSPDITKRQGSGKMCSLSQGLIINKKNPYNKLN